MQGKAGKTKRQSRQENSLLRSRYPAQYGSRPKCLPLAVDTVPKIVRAVLLSCRAEVATGKPRRKRSGACLIADITRQPLGSLKLTYPINMRIVLALFIIFVTPTKSEHLLGPGYASPGKVVMTSFTFPASLFHARAYLLTKTK